MWDLNVYTFLNITWIFKSQRNKNHIFYPQHYKFATDLYHTLGETYFCLNTDIQVYLTVWNPVMIPAEAHLILGQAERMDGITARINNISHSKEYSVILIHFWWILKVQTLFYYKSHFVFAVIVTQIWLWVDVATHVKELYLQYVLFPCLCPICFH